MPILHKTLPLNVKDFKAKYPVAFDYFTDKSDVINMTFEPGSVMIKDNFGWLKYDIQDVEIFNQLVKTEI